MRARPSLHARLGTLTQLGKIRNQREQERLRRELDRQGERNEAIRNFLDVDPRQATRLMVEKILEDIKGSAKEGKNEYTWNPCDWGMHSKTLQMSVIVKLRQLGLSVRVQCGHGHGGGQKCDGTTYSSCWPEIIISW